MTETCLSSPCASMVGDEKQEFFPCFENSERTRDLLREEFRREGLLNEKGIPRLNRAIGYFCNDQRDIGSLVDLFTLWRDEPEYMVLRRFVRDPRVSGSGKHEYVAVKCSKRGNDVYVSRIRKRFKFLNGMVKDHEFFKPSDFTVSNDVRSSILWFTLTYDTKRCSRREAWENVGHEWNRFISAMRRRYGRISVMRSWEAFENGYPHVHAILWFEEAKFSVYPHLNAKGEFSYRVKEKTDFEALWHSWIDTTAISSMRKATNYVSKYQLKVIQGHENSGSKDKQTTLALPQGSRGSLGSKTLAFMWLFRKKSFSVSGSFRGLFSDLIRSLHFSNMERQIDLMGNVLEAPVWEFVGVFSGRELGLNPFIWASGLSGDQVKTVLASENA